MFGAKGGGGLFAPKDNTKAAAVTKVSGWLAELLPDEERADYLYQPTTCLMYPSGIFVCSRNGAICCHGSCNGDRGIPISGLIECRPQVTAAVYADVHSKLFDDVNSPGGKAVDGKETNVIVNQLACKEDECPDVELVITLLRPKPRPKLMFKIYLAAVDLSREELERELLSALAVEAGGGGGHGHGAPPQEREDV